MNVYQQIRENLKHRAYGVNTFIALAGVENFEEGVIALNEMCVRGQVEVDRVHLPDKHGGTSMVKTYRLAPPMFPYLVVDNTKELDSKES